MALIFSTEKEQAQISDDTKIGGDKYGNPVAVAVAVHI
jgi:hypothetical protein